MIAVQSRLTRVGRENHDHLRLLGRIVDRRYGQPGRLHRVAAARVFTQADNDIDSAVLEIARVRVSLAAVADDCDTASIETPDIGVLVVKEFRHDFLR